jgi:putative membrane protein
MKKHQLLLAGAGAFGLLLFGVAAPAQQNGTSANRLSSADSTFATKAAQGGLAEVQLGQLAKDKASNQAVKDFGQRMIDDHTKANDDLKNVASKEGITLPTSLDAKDQATYDRLSKLSGPEFDKAYMHDMVMDHRTDVNEFRRESEHGANPGLKAFATRTLPVLEQHLSLAEQTDAKVKNEK